MKLAIPGSSSTIRIRFIVPTSTTQSSSGASWSIGSRMSNLRSLPGPAHDPHPASVSLCDRAHDREPDPCPLVAAAAAHPAREARKDPPLLARTDSRAGVTNPDRGLLPVHRRPDPDLVPDLGVGDRVLRQVHHRLGDPLAVGDDRPRRRRVDRPAAIGHPARLGYELVGELGEAHGLELEEVGALGLREQQQVVDEAAHPIELAGDQRDRLAPARLVGNVSLGEQLEVARARSRSAFAARG